MTSAPITDQQSKIACPLCGAQYTEAEGRRSCPSCPLDPHCRLLRCPSCAYELPAPTRLTRWLSRVWPRRRVNREL